jgi:hypothetical protein
MVQRCVKPGLALYGFKSRVWPLKLTAETFGSSSASNIFSCKVSQVASYTNTRKSSFEKSEWSYPRGMSKVGGCSEYGPCNTPRIHQKLVYLLSLWELPSCACQARSVCMPISFQHPTLPSTMSRIMRRVLGISVGLLMWKNPQPNCQGSCLRRRHSQLKCNALRTTICLPLLYLL